jgi:uncharacterized membrane protein YsdA (DUF1294 family)
MSVTIDRANGNAEVEAVNRGIPGKDARRHLPCVGTPLVRAHTQKRSNLFSSPADTSDMRQIGRLAQSKDEQGPGFAHTVKGPGSLAFAVFFALYVAVSAWEGRLPLAVPGIYMVASTFAFIAYQRDKSKARSNQWRIREDTLHLWSLIGGWPGAALAQKLYHHKSKKRSFQAVYWATIVLNMLGFFWLLTPPGSARLRSLLAGIGLG